MSGFKNLVGGEMRSYTEMMDEARAIATRRMVEEAEHLGADSALNAGRRAARKRISPSPRRAWRNSRTGWDE